MTPPPASVLKITSILWVVWGIVHAFFGVAVLSFDASDGFAAIAAGVDADAVGADYHPAVEAILNQHGWNLLWFGLVTTLGGIMIWKGSRTAIWVCAMVAGLADLGYLIFVDFGGYGTFVPGTLMTIIAGSAILLGGWILLSERRVPTAAASA